MEPTFIYKIVPSIKRNTVVYRINDHLDHNEMYAPSRDKRCLMKTLFFLPLPDKKLSMNRSSVKTKSAAGAALSVLNCFFSKIFKRYAVYLKLLIIKRDLFDLGKVFQCFFACVFERFILVDIGGGYQDVVAIFEHVKATYSYECFIAELFDICF